MTIRGAGSVCAAVALAAVVGAPGVATAASESFSDTFNFALERPLLPAFAAAAVNDDINTYSGSTDVALAQFDTLGGTRTLNSVSLNLNMSINGQVYVYPILRTVSALSAESEVGYGVTAELTGYASVNGLTAHADLDDVHGEPPVYQFTAAAIDEPNGFDYLLPINEGGDGSDSTTNFADLADFIGTGNVDVLVFASVFVNYLDIGNAGTAQGLGASGTVELVYDYSTNGNVIPTPAAAGLGLAMLGGLIGRRRR